MAQRRSLDRFAPWISNTTGSRLTLPVNIGRVVMNSLRLVLLASAVASAMICGSARAGLVGDTVNITRDYPIITTVESDLGDQVVGGGVEYPSWQGHMSIDVSDGNIL